MVKMQEHLYLSEIVTLVRDYYLLTVEVYTTEG